MAKGNTATEKTRRISAELLVFLVPMIAAFIIIVAVVLFINSRSVIIDEGKSGLKNESLSNANDIGSTIGDIKGYYNGLADTISASTYAGDAAILKALEPGMAAYPDVVIDCYIGLSDKSFYDGGGWVPDADYDPTTRAWYTDGVANDKIFLGAPSVDLTTGQMVVCGSRSISLSDNIPLISLFDHIVIVHAVPICNDCFSCTLEISGNE